MRSSNAGEKFKKTQKITGKTLAIRRVFWYHIKEMDAAAYDAAVSLMDAERQRRVKDFPNEDDRKRSAAGEWLLRRAVAGRLGGTPETAPLRWDENGKPYVEGAPFHVSVSHSGPYVVCAVDAHVLGVDVEVIRGTEEKFMHRACSDAEMAYIRYGDAGCYQRFWECWTAKEALFKLTGKGPLLSLSRLALPQGVVLDHIIQNGCAVTVAMML